MLELVTDQEDLPTNDRCFARQIRELLRMEYQELFKTNPPNYAKAASDQMATRRIRQAIREGTKELEESTEIDKHWKIF